MRVVLLMTLLFGSASPVCAELIYAVSDTNNALYVVDTDGALTFDFVGSYTLETAGESFLGGLEPTPDGFLYGISATANARLYIVDPTDAATTTVGLLDVGFVFEGGLGIDPSDGTLYGVNLSGSADPSLFTIDPLTGLATEVGVIAGGNHDFLGLAFDNDGNMLGVDRVTNALWRIDKANPSGPDTFQVADIGGGIVIGSGGMAGGGTEAFVYTSNSRHLFTIDLATGDVNVITQYASAPNILGISLAPSSVTDALFLRGDVDGSGAFVGLVDALALLAFQFQGGPEPPCPVAADPDGDDVVNGLVDTLYILNFQFQGGPPPLAPFPTCDVADATPLGCLTPPPCP